MKNLLSISYENLNKLFTSITKEYNFKSDYCSQELDQDNGNMDSINCEKQDMIIIEPNSFDQTPEIVDKLKNNYSVIINLTDVNHQLATKIIDFLSGAVYAIEGRSEKIAKNIFLFTPSKVEIVNQVSNNPSAKEIKNLSLDIKESSNSE